MDQDHILQTLRLVAWVLCFFIISCWGGCASTHWISLQEKKVLVGALTDTTAQRLYTLTPNLALVDYGSNSENLESESKAREAIIKQVLAGAEPKTALAEAGVAPPDPTNQAVTAVMDVANGG